MSGRATRIVTRQTTRWLSNASPKYVIFIFAFQTPCLSIICLGNFVNFMNTYRLSLGVGGVDRVYNRKSVPDFFCHLNHLNLAFFGICINQKGCPLLTFHQPTGFYGCPSLTFHQPKDFQGVPTPTFHQPTGFYPSLFINPMVFRRCPPLTFHQPTGF